MPPSRHAATHPKSIVVDGRSAAFMSLTQTSRYYFSDSNSNRGIVPPPLDPVGTMRSGQSIRYN